MLVPTNLLQLDILSSLVGPYGMLQNAKVRLVTAATLTGDATMDSVTEADFPGYVAQDVVWDAPVILPDGGAAVLADTNTFRSDDSIEDPQEVQGYVVTDAAGDTLYWGELFAEPVTISSPYQGLAVVPTFAFAAQPQVDDEQEI